MDLKTAIATALKQEPVGLTLEQLAAKIDPKLYKDDRQKISLELNRMQNYNQVIKNLIPKQGQEIAGKKYRWAITSLGRSAYSCVHADPEPESIAEHLANIPVYPKHTELEKITTIAAGTDPSHAYAETPQKITLADIKLPDSLPQPVDMDLELEVQMLKTAAAYNMRLEDFTTKILNKCGAFCIEEALARIDEWLKSSIELTNFKRAQIECPESVNHIITILELLGESTYPRAIDAIKFLKDKDLLRETYSPTKQQQLILDISKALALSFDSDPLEEIKALADFRDDYLRSHDPLPQPSSTLEIAAGEAYFDPTDPIELAMIKALTAYQASKPLPVKMPDLTDAELYIKTLDLYASAKTIPFDDAITFGEIKEKLIELGLAA